MGFKEGIAGLDAFTWVLPSMSFCYASGGLILKFWSFFKYFFYFCRDGRLREQDQILAIDGQPLDISHQEAIRILQSARGLVVLIIARGYQSPQFEPPQLVNEPVQGSAPNVQAEVQSEMVVSINPCLS